MKFTEEQAVEALRAELTNKGRKTLHMSERTLASLTEKLVKKLATEETGLPDFVADAIEILDVTEGDARKKNSDFAKYKENHPDYIPPKDEPERDDPPKGNPELDALKAEIEALKAVNAQNEKNQKLSAKRTELVAALGAKGVKDKEWLDNFLSEVNITEGIDVESKAEIYAKLYNKSKANVPPTPTPGNPTGGADNPFLKTIQESAQLAKNERANIETNKE